MIVAIAAMFAIPTAALAAGGAFTSKSATPAVSGTNTNAKGIGVQGTGKKYGVYSKGPLGVAAGKSLSCTGCVGPGALSASAKSGRLIFTDQRSFSGPYAGTTSGLPAATFTVPAGDMCVTASASAFAAAPGLMSLQFYASPGAPLIFLDLYANEAGSHKALVAKGTQCSQVPAGTYAYQGFDHSSGNTHTDGSDVANLSVQVFSPTF